MSLSPVIRDAIRLLFLAVLEHQYVVLFFVVAIEEAGIPLPAPTDVVIAFYVGREIADRWLKAEAYRRARNALGAGRQALPGEHRSAMRQGALRNRCSTMNLRGSRLRFRTRANAEEG